MVTIVEAPCMSSLEYARYRLACYRQPWAQALLNELDRLTNQNDELTRRCAYLCGIIERYAPDGEDEQEGVTEAAA